MRSLTYPQHVFPVISRTLVKVLAGDLIFLPYNELKAHINIEASHSKSQTSYLYFFRETSIEVLKFAERSSDRKKTSFDIKVLLLETSRQLKGLTDLYQAKEYFRSVMD